MTLMGFVLSVYIMTTTCIQYRRQYGTDVECLYNDIHNYRDNMTLMGFVLSVYIMIFITTDTDGFCVECLYNDIHNYNMYTIQETI